jgi:hypothetical protein
MNDTEPQTAQGGQAGWDLLEQRSFKRAVTMHRYAIRDAKEAISC